MCGRSVQDGDLARVNGVIIGVEMSFRVVVDNTMSLLHVLEDARRGVRLHRAYKKKLVVYVVVPFITQYIYSYT